MTYASTQTKVIKQIIKNHALRLATGLGLAGLLWLGTVPAYADGPVFRDSGQQFPGYSESWAVALGDVDGDGDLDAWVANSVFDEFGYSGAPNRVWINDSFLILIHFPIIWK